jgi:RecA/RadA recombinase
MVTRSTIFNQNCTTGEKMSKLLQKMLKAGSAGSTILSESDMFKEQDLVKTSLPIINVAYSGKIDGGFGSGLTILAGESKTFKTALALYCMRAYLEKHKDGIGILYDSEGGCNPQYIKSFGIDPDRIVHVPVEHVEQLKFDFVKKLEEIEKGDKVFFLVDSIGQIASKKETDDASDEKSVADMTRAKAIRSLLRLVTVQLNKKLLPCFMINHVYQEMGLFPKVVIPGGTSVTYAANTIFVITKAQDKNSNGEIEGWHFTLNVHKSRFVREKSKFPFTVNYETGIKPYSGMLDMAIELGAVIKPSNGWYSRVDLTTGEVEDKKFRAKDTESEDFWGPVLSCKMFSKKVEDRYMLAAPQVSDETLDDAVEEMMETE